MTTLESVIRSDPEVLGGPQSLLGLGSPSRTCSTTWPAGDSLETFLDHFPSVTREQAVAALECAKDLLIARAHPAG